MKKFLLLFTLLLSFGSAFSSPAWSLPNEESCQMLLEEAWKCEEMYEEGLCHANIHRLIEFMKKREVDLSRSRVLYLYAKENVFSDVSPFGPAIFAARTRTGFRWWRHHVVLEHPEKVDTDSTREVMRILDLDFTRSARSVSPEDYFGLMYLDGVRILENYSGPDFLDLITIRPIPALDYLRDFGEWSHEQGTVQNSTFYVYEANEMYPEISLREYLSVPQGHVRQTLNE